MYTIRLAALAAFAVTLWLSVWQNDFPASYHPDEPAKVAQVLSGERNFHHPPLMLDIAAAVLHFRDGARPATPERAVQTGRWLSAFYMAAACACLTWLAGFYGGAIASVLAACLLAGNTQATLAGHFFKEDPLFVLGLALTLLAGAYRWKFPQSRLSLLALGIAAGFAAATKYLGVIALIYATALEVAMPPKAAAGAPRAGWRLLALWLSGLGVMCLLSLGSWLGQLPSLYQAVFAAGRTTQTGNDAVGSRVPHWQFVGMFFIETPLPALLGVVLFGGTLVRGARPARAHFDRWLLFSAPFVLLLIFSFSAITAVRYFLPISVLLACLGGCGLAIGTRLSSDWAGRRWRLPRGLVTGAVILACVLAQLPALIALERGFATDDRRALRAYIATHLPDHAVIAADDLAGLTAPPALSQRVLTCKAVADLGDLATLRAQGVTHVVVCWYDSRRFVDPRKHPAPGTESVFLRRRAFYLGLDAHTRRLWHSEIAQPFPLRPGLSLYALPPAFDGQ